MVSDRVGMEKDSNLFKGFGQDPVSVGVTQDKFFLFPLFFSGKWTLECGADLRGMGSECDRCTLSEIPK